MTITRSAISADKIAQSNAWETIKSSALTLRGHQVHDGSIPEKSVHKICSIAVAGLSGALRELAEEASLHLPEPGRLRGSGVIRTQRPEPQGWHDEQLLVYNLQVPDTRLPVNRDGEVQAFLRLSPSEVVTRMQAGEFTPDACASLARGLGLMTSRLQRPDPS